MKQSLYRGETQLITGLQRATEHTPTFKPTFLDVTFAKSDLLQALDLIGPAYDDESFAVRHGIARMIAMPIMRSFENRKIRVDPRTGRADMREIEESLRQALAGTEFTAKILQQGGAHHLVVSILPERWSALL